MTRVAILGATGYTALELIKLLLRHPEVEITALTSRQEGNPHVASVHPSLIGRIDLRLEDIGPAAVASRADCVFSCLPHGASATVVPQLLAAGARVDRFQRRLPARHRGQLCRMVRPEASRSGARRQSRLWPAGTVSRADRRCPISGQSGLLSDVGHFGPRAAAEGRADRAARHHRRFEKRRERRRPHAEADDPFSRVQRKHLGLQRRPASPHARDRADSSAAAAARR